MGATKKTASTVLNGVKKGGTRFPRYSLGDMLDCAKRLASKAHASAITKDIFYSGVLQSVGTTAEIKASTLKQYGFLVGSVADGFSPSDSARKLLVAEGEGLAKLLSNAALNPPTFSGMYEPFQGDTVTRGRLRQRAAELQVHPDYLDKCVDIYIETLALGKVLTECDDGKISHAKKDDGTLLAVKPLVDEVQVESTLPEKDGEEVLEGQSPAKIDAGLSDNMPAPNLPSPSTGGGKPALHVNISVDSSLDTDKLERQLALLRKYNVL